MTSNPYEILGVPPGAEHAAIQAAYRALIRRYHPDTNPDPQAQAWAREITAAFSVLGNPARRAEYDAGDNLWLPDRPQFDEGQHGPPPMRNVGLAAVALTLALSLAVAVWPARNGPPSAPETLASAPVQEMAQAAPEDAPRLETIAIVDPAEDLPADTAAEDVEPPLPLTRAPRQPRPPLTREVAELSPEAQAVPKPLLRKTAEVKDSRPQQVEQMAAGFLKQSLEHADWSKQQLLLSAQIRSKTSRTLCRSDDCVANVYLRQMRETTAIMEGRVPGQ